MPFSHAAPAWAQAGQTAANAENYSDTGLTPETWYRHRVCAFNAAGNSAWSAETTAQTPAAGGSQAPTPPADPAPDTAGTLYVESEGSCSDLSLGASQWFSVPHPTDSHLSVAVTTSGGQEPNADPWAAVDGNPETFWAGLPGAGGWWVTLTYSHDVSVAGIAVYLAAGPAAPALILGSLDAKGWYDIVAPIKEHGVVRLGYLWIIFPDDGGGTPPQVREISVDFSP